METRCLFYSSFSYYLYSAQSCCTGGLVSRKSMAKRVVRFGSRFRNTCARGFLFSVIAAGFESPAIFVGALILGIPSSIGGALAGWIQGSSDAADRKMEVS
jgi:hypothetical protein